MSDFDRADGVALLAHMGTDASKWAAEFCRIAQSHGHNLDEGWMTVWFANAIEAGIACGSGRRPFTTPGDPS